MQTTQFVASDSIYSMFCSSNIYTQHRRDDIKFLLFTVFSVENTKTRTSSTGQRRNACLANKSLKASAGMIMRSLQVIELYPPSCSYFQPERSVKSSLSSVKDILGGSFSVSRGKHQYVNSADCLHM